MDTNLHPTEYSPLDFIGEGNWEKALFATYALSLTYFETYVLPKLRQAGCEQVWILVDKDGYRTSLMELRARHVGQTYSLIPISLPSGIFHPKLTYLWGASGDLLMVGSGNMTYGGHGQNIEVLEVLSPATDAQAFADLSSFLGELGEQETFEIADRTPLARFQERSLYVSKSGGETGGTRLIHSLAKPIGPQIADLAAGKKWDSLLVLSPFHNPDGGPVNALAKRLNVKSIEVGVPTEGTKGFSFPFDKADDWGLAITAVTPDIEKGNRRLHAKWLELRGSENWGITGSVNATNQSMDSTRNVEVAVVRILGEPTTKLWKQAKRTSYQADAYIPGSNKSTMTVFAELNTEGVLSGAIMGSRNLGGDWHAYLEFANEIEAEGTLQVNGDGRFTWKLEKAFEFDAENTPQVRLIRNGTVARGWVHVQSFLKMPSQARNAVGALGRMLNRAESPDDIRAFLDYIAFHAGHLVTLKGNQAKSPKTKESQLPNDKPISVEDLYLGNQPSQMELFKKLAADSIQNDKSWEVLHTITRLLLGRKDVGKPHAQGISKAKTKAHAPADNDAQAELIKTRVELTDFGDRLRKALQTDELEPEKREQLLFVWANVSLDMYLRRLHSRDEALDFSKGWLQNAIRSDLPDQNRKMVDEIVFGIAAALARNTIESIQDSNAVFGITTTKRLIHEWLETYCRGPVGPTKAIGLAENWFGFQTVAAGANLLKFSRSEIAGNYVSAQWDAETVLG